jgi:uracil-DNA glycosylase family 4
VDDGLELTGVWIAAVTRCAPPDNKPTPIEISNCRVHLEAEIAALSNLRVYVALGRIAFDACWQMLAARGIRTGKRPPFEHGRVYRVAGAPTIVAAYHPSRQNTHTGRLTASMLRAALSKAKAESTRGDPRSSSWTTQSPGRRRKGVAP